MVDSPSTSERDSLSKAERLWPAYGFAVVVAVVLILLLVILAPTPRVSPAVERVGTGASASITITSVHVGFTGTSHCWTSVITSGGKLTGGQQFTVNIVLKYSTKASKPSACTVTSVSVATSGFSLVKANVPLIVNSGSSRTLSITVTVPANSYVGALTINAVATSSSRTHLSAS